MRNLFEQAVARQADRVSQLEEPTKEQLMELRPEDLEEGHHGVHILFHPVQAAQLIQLGQQLLQGGLRLLRGLVLPLGGGGPGLLRGQIYHAVGVLSKGQLVEVDRSGLVAGFVGQTALKTQEVIEHLFGIGSRRLIQSVTVLFTHGTEDGQHLLPVVP